jgi:tRNA (guanine-N7-)-methyltransferase
MRERRHIEREFGVPFAGEILPPERWTNTSLKQMPAEGPLDWPTLFGRSAPVVLDLGCGNGRFLLQSSVWRPDHDHLGVDVLPVVIRYARRRGNQRGLTNLRFAVGDARELLQRWVRPSSVAEIHCYHPQPYYDPAQAHRRLLSPAFLASVHRALIPGGLFFVQTDNRAYWDYLRQVLPAFFDFSERSRTWPDAPKGRTRREILDLRRGLPVFRGSGSALTLGAAELDHRAQTLPPPTFDAGTPPRELEELERLGE